MRWNILEGAGLWGFCFDYVKNEMPIGPISGGYRVGGSSYINLTQGRGRGSE